MQLTKRYSVSGLCLYLLPGVFWLASCSPEHYRQQADEVTYDAIRDAQEVVLGTTEAFTIEQPSDTLRRRLLLDQDLPYVGQQSLGVHELEPIAHWPDDDYLSIGRDHRDDLSAVRQETPLGINLLEALKIAAASSRTYQLEKEGVFRVALALDLERNDFRAQFFSFIRGDFVSNQNSPVFNAWGSRAEGRVDQLLKNGTQLSMAMGVSIASLISGSDSSRGINLDASISIPLLRGSGEWVVAEPLIQAERNTLYAIADFERFKQTFAVQIATDYYRVLQALDQVSNAENNYRRNVVATRLSIALGQAGRLKDIEVDQARQNELRARATWISAQQRYAAVFDQFKITLGLPPDASIELDREDLITLAHDVGAEVEQEGDLDPPAKLENLPAGDDPVDLEAPTYPQEGLLGLTELVLMDLAFMHRLDLQVREGRVYDAMRRVTVAADRLGAELTLFGVARYGGTRGPGSAGADNANLRFSEGRYDAFLTLNLPLERTAERNVYRNSLINLNDSVLRLQDLEDNIKLNIRNGMRELLESRESVRIQARAVTLASRRVQSTDLSLQAGRAQVRDLLDAQNDLLQSQNDLTAAVVSYRLAQLRLQRDAGVLEVDAHGLWNELEPQTLLAMRDEVANNTDSAFQSRLPGISLPTREMSGPVEAAVADGGGLELVEPPDARSVEETLEQTLEVNHE